MAHMITDVLIIGTGPAGLAIEARAREVTDAGCVLVRPDQRAAWRSDGAARDPKAERLRARTAILMKERAS